MAFASTRTGTSVFGNKRVSYGTFTNGATDTGGAITTGLSVIDMAKAIVTSHIASAQPQFTISGGTLTLGTENDADGRWEVWGR